MTKKEVWVYAGWRAGFVVCMVRDDPEFTEHTAEIVADMIVRGLRVERLTWEVAHRAFPPRLSDIPSPPSLET